MPLSTIHTLVVTLLASLPGLHPPAQRRGRPRIYDDSLILTLWLYQTLHQLSYREVLSTAQQQGFRVPSLRAYHYRVHRLDPELLQRLIEAVGKLLLQQKQRRWKRLIADGTGFGFGQKYLLKWMRGSQVRQVSSHVRLVTLVAVDEKGRSVIVSCSCGGPYSSEVRLLEEVLRRLEKLPAVPLVADRGFDAVGLMQRVKELGGAVAIGVKETWRVRVRHPLRQESQQGWKKYGRERYRVEGVFGVLKQKLGSWWAVVREEMAKKMALAAALLYNLYLLVVSGYLDGSFCLLVSAFYWLVLTFLWRLYSCKIAYNIR